MTVEAEKITKEEIKYLKRIYALKYFELAFYLGGWLPLEHARATLCPKSRT